MFNSLVIIRGAGDLASGTAYRLVKAGFPVLMTELPQPLLVRTTVSYGTCIINDSVIVEGIEARRYRLDRLDEARSAISPTFIPVVVDPAGESIRALHPTVVVDGRVAKVKLDTTIDDAPLVVALGPGFIAGVDCHAVIETNRGHNLGRVYGSGSAEPDTGRPANVNGIGADRILRAPCDGQMWQFAVAGEVVKKGRLVATVSDVPVYAPFDGVVRGLVDTYVRVKAGVKIGDIDPRAKREYCFTISDKSLAVAGGVLEAILSAPQVRAHWRSAANEATA